MPKKLVINCETGKKEYIEMAQAELAQRDIDEDSAAVLLVEEDRKEAVWKRELIVELGMKKAEAAKLGPEYIDLITDLQARISVLEQEL